MTEQARPGGRPVIILDIPLTDARPRPSDPAVRTDTTPARTPDAAPSRPAVPDAAPSTPVRPAVSAPSAGWVSEPDEEEADGQWYVTRPLATARPRPRTRAASPTGRVHLVLAALAVPAAGGIGILVTVAPTVGDALAGIYPFIILTTAALAWLFLSRPGAWVRGLIGAAVGMLRR